MRRRITALATLTAAVSGLALGACGSTGVATPRTTVPTHSTGTTAASGPAKPTVALPATLPTSLKVADLTKGTGPGAQAGDTLELYYVGVRSADGQEFDSNYGKALFELQLGAGRVIPGWDQGLVGVQQGGRRQLDIPAALAYGDQPPGGAVIKAGDALTFVVDVVAVLGASKAADQPTVTVAPAANSATVQIKEITVGNGTAVGDVGHAALQLVLYRADTGALITSTWGHPAAFVSTDPNGGTLPGILAALKGMKVGGRRVVQIPNAMMFDGKGNTQLGLPPAIDLVIVVDLIGVY
jgi:peptidylprolyl isomerase